MKIKTYIQLLLLFGFIFLPVSCQEDTPITGSGQTTFGTTEVTFTLQTSSQLFISTRADVTKEIEQLHILAFENQGSDVYSFEYKITTNAIEDISESNEKKVTVKIPVATTGKKHKLVLLANIEETLLSNLNPGEDLSVLDDLIHENRGKWNPDLPIPMWGETSTDILLEGLNISASVKMLRMLARVDVVMNLSDPELFRLKEVWVFNTNSKGRIVPGQSNLTSAGTVENVSLPVDAGKLAAADAFVYDAGDENAVRDIYLYELEQDKDDAKETAPALVIGGMYDHDTQMTYYRVNLVHTIDKSTGEKEEIYPDILRNYWYRLSIRDIYGAGYDDKETAMASAPSLSGDLGVFSDGQTQIYFDGEDYLSVGENLYQFAKSSASELLKIDANQPWEFEVDVNWITATKESGGIRFGVQANNGTDTRQGYITITTDKFRAEVLIIQTTDEYISLSIRDRYGNDVTELLFSSCLADLSVTPQELTVSWSPADVVCIVSASDGEVPFVYGNNSAQLGDGTSAYGGSETFRIYPQMFTEQEVRNDPFIEKVKYLDFMVSDGEHYSTKRITLLQRNLALLINDEIIAPVAEYQMGRNYSVSITSNAPWTYDLPYSGLSMLEWAEMNGNTFNFRIRDDESYYGTTVPVTFYSTDPGQYFQPIQLDLKVIKNFPNCYILKPGESASIPTAHIYDLHEKLFGNRPQGTISAEILWKDQNNDFIQTGYNNGTIWVTSSAAGNAVVAAKINNEVIWSWHIWVTSYDPETTNKSYTVAGYENTFMTVNLGATTTSANQINNLGLYYQWGRKDPFPGANSTGSGGNNNPRPIYDKSNREIGVLFQPVGNDNLAYTIQNPYTFITASGYPFDWYTSSSSEQNDFLWNDENNYKTIFDPCPAGWRVPYAKDGISPWGEVVGVSDASNGVNFPVLGGYHPLAGNMNNATGAIENITKRIYLWMSSTNKEAAYGMTAGYYSIDSWDIRYRARGATIRCVKE